MSSCRYVPHCHQTESYCIILPPTKKQRERGKSCTSMGMQRSAHASKSSSSTAFCPNIPCHRPGCSSFPVRVWFQQLTSLEPPLWLAKLSSPSHLKQQQHLLWLPEGSCFSHALPTQDDTYPHVPGIPPVREHLSPLVPLSSPRKLVSGNLSLFMLLWIRAEFDPLPFGNGQITVLERDFTMLCESFMLSSLLLFFPSCIELCCLASCHA